MKAANAFSKNSMRVIKEKIVENFLGETKERDKEMKRVFAIDYQLGHREE